MERELRLWFWIITDECTGKRMRITWRMTEKQALGNIGEFKR